MKIWIWFEDQPAFRSLQAVKDDYTLAFELHICLLHNSKIRVPSEHFRPLSHTLQDLGFDLLMAVLQSNQSHSQLVGALINVPDHLPILRWRL